MLSLRFGISMLLSSANEVNAVRSETDESCDGAANPEELVAGIQGRPSKEKPFSFLAVIVPLLNIVPKMLSCPEQAVF